MASRVGNLNVLLTAETGKFASKMKGAAKTVSTTGSKIAGATKTVLKYGAAFAGIAAGGMAFFVKNSLSAIDNTAKLSTQLRISTESLSAYRLAADISGTSMEQVGNSLQKMTKNLGDAQIGIGTAKDGLAQLGLSITDLQGLKTEQQFELIADKISGLQDPLAKASAANAIFGRSGQQILNFLDLGSEGLDQFRKETEAAGTSLSRFDAAKVEQANDAMRRIKEIFNGVIQQLTIRLAPIITAISKQILGLAGDSKGFGTVLDTVINVGIQGVGILLDAWDGLKIVWNLGKIALAEIGIVGNTAINGMTKAFQFMGQLGGAIWDIQVNGAKMMGSVFMVVIQGIRSGFTSMISFVGEGISAVLKQAESVAVSAGLFDLADKLSNAQGEIAASTIRMSEGSAAGLAEATANVGKFATATFDAQAKVAALVTGGGPELAGSEEAVARITTLEQMKQQAITNVQTVAQAERSSISFQNALAAAQAEANAEAAQIAQREQMKTDMILTADQERKGMLTEQQTAWQEQFGKSEQAAVQKNQQLWASGMRGRMKVVGGVLGSIGNLMQSENRKQFEIGKAASIASTGIATIETSMQAYKSLAGIPIIGPALGIAAAAAATLSGINAVNQIKNTSFGGGSTPSFSGGGGTVGAAAATASPGGSPADLEAVSATAATQVTINAEDEGALLDGRKVVDLINAAQADGALISSVRLGTTNV